MKNANKKTKAWDYEDDEESAAIRERNFQRRQNRNWKKAWLEHSHDAEEHDEFFK